MDLNRVAVFVRVVEAEGFSAAARVLRLPKSSVSRNVRQLEEELGAQLVVRTTRQIRLTDAGRAFYDRAARALAELEEARSAAGDHEGEPRGVVRITAPVDFGVWMLAPITAAFVRRYPEVRVELMLTNRVVDLVREGVDLAVRMGPLDDSSLVVRAMPPMEAGLFAAPRYLAGRTAPRSPADLPRHDCVLFRSSTGKARWALTCPSGPDTVEVRGALAADDFFFVLEAVRAGAGIGLLPLYLGAADPTLVRVLPKHVVPAGRASVVYPSARHVPRRVLLLRDAILEHVATRCPKDGGRPAGPHRPRRPSGTSPPRR